MLRSLHFFRKNKLSNFYRTKYTKLSPLADTFNYGPNNVAVKGNKVTGLFGVDYLTTPKGFRSSLDDCYSDCHMLLYEAKDPNRKRKMVQVLDDLSDTLCRAADLADCVRALHSDESFRTAANAVCLNVGNLVESLNTDSELYEAAVRASSPSTSADITPESDADATDKRVLNLFVEDFEQSGVHLKDASDHQAFLKAAEQNMELSVQFNQAAHSPVILKSDVLKRISKDVDWTHFNGRRLFAPYYNAPQPFLRALSYSLFHGPVEGQEECLFELLNARDKMASSAGKECYLRRAIQASSLAESPERVASFLEKVSSLLSPVATKTALSQLGKDLKEADRLRPWDIPFFIHQGQHWKGSERLLPYFSLGACMEGVNQLADCLFGLRLQAEPALPGEVWHPDVVKVAVYTTEAQTVPEGEEPDPWEAKYPIGPGIQVGTIYCDFFDRKGKMPQDCHYTVRGGRHTENTMFEAHSPYQFPIVVIQLNLGPSPAESVDGVPLLLQPGQVENLFHEWGHALHSVLGRTRFQHVTGTRCSTDLAELPSTLMEHFALDTRVTAQYARHFETGEAPNSSTDVKALLRLNTSRGYGQSVEVMQQLIYSMLDQRLHSGCPSRILAAFPPSPQGVPPSSRLFAQLYREHCDAWWSHDLPPLLSHLPLAESHRFSHLCGYGGRYYAYLMARAGAGVVWRKGFAGDPWSSSFGRLYRDTVLRYGGERQPAAMLTKLVGGEEGCLSPEQLAQGLCENLEAGEETARTVHQQAEEPGWKLVR